MFKFELGQTVKEKVTGFKGAIMGRTEYTTGCIQYGILNAQLDKDGKMQDWVWLDESRLEIDGKKITGMKSIGGPQPSAPEI